MIVIVVFIGIILLGLLINSINKKKNRGLFKQLGGRDYKPISGLSLEQLDNLPLDDERVVEEYKNILKILKNRGISIWVSQSYNSLWRYSVTSEYKGDFLGSNKNYSTKQEAYYAAFIHVLKEWI